MRADAAPPHALLVAAASVHEGETAQAPPGAMIDGNRPTGRVGPGGEPAPVTRARDAAPGTWVVVRRLPSPTAGSVEAALDVLLDDWPDAVLLACADGRAVQQTSVKLAVREARLGLPAGTTAMFAAPGPAGLLAPHGLARASRRLRGLVFDPAILTEDRSPVRVADAATGDDATTAVLRTLLLLAARSAGVAAYDALSKDAHSTTDGETFAAECRQAAALGFHGRLARTAGEAAIVAAVFARGGFAVSPVA